MQETGQRSDGSYKPLIAQGDGRRVAVEDQTADALEEIASNRYGRGGPRILDARVKELERFLSLCHERGIRVIGFIPPVAQEEHDALISTNNEYTETVRTLYARFDATLADFTFPLYDTSSLRALGSSNSELLDGRHGSEKATLRVLLYLAKKDPAFASLIRPDAAALIRKSTSDIEVL
jgi:hypothetical protein